MKSLSINGKKLQEVRMLMKPFYPGSISYLSYPKSQIHFEFREDELILRIPPMLALELYRSGTIPQEQDKAVAVGLSGKNQGLYCIVDVRFPNSFAGQLIEFTLKKLMPQNNSQPGSV